MKKEQKVLNYYVICNRLKDVIRKDGQFKKYFIQQTEHSFYKLKVVSLNYNCG